MARTRKTKEFVYTNAPLREVIAELRWGLQSIESVSGAAIDPFFQILSDKFTERMAKAGFVVVEPRLPTPVPLEFFGHQVTRLYRKAPKAWPAYQIGPGVFTANIVPPYKGWSSFLPTVGAGLDHLFAAHPDHTYLQLQDLQLRYLNLFSEAHGLESPSSFVRDVLGLAVTPPKSVVETALDGLASIRNFGTLRFPLIKPANASGTITWKEGTRAEKPVLLLDFAVKVGLSGQLSVLELQKLFDEAHEVTTQWFEGFAEGSLKDRLGEKVQA